MNTEERENFREHFNWYFEEGLNWVNIKEEGLNWVNIKKEGLNWVNIKRGMLEVEEKRSGWGNVDGGGGWGIKLVH